MQLPKPAWADKSEIVEYVVCIAGRQAVLDLRSLQRVCDTVSFSGIENAEAVARMHFDAAGADAFGVLKKLYAELPAHDVWVLPQSERRKKLLICDMDSTIIKTESLDELASFMGIAEQVSAITTRAMNGEIGFHDALHERVSLLAGLPYAHVNECVQQTQYNRGARRLLRDAKAAGLRTVLVSGGFSPFVSFVAADLGFDHWVANELEVAGDKLTGRVLGPIVDKNTKLEVLQRECDKLGIAPVDACTVGDGANDIEMLVAAGTGVAYRAKKIVLQATPYHLRHADLDAITQILDLSANRGGRGTPASGKNDSMAGPSPQSGQQR